MIGVLSDKLEGIDIISAPIEGDFSILKNGSYEINSSDFIKGLDFVVNLIQKEKGPTNLNIHSGTYDLQLVIQLYLLSYKYNKMNFVILDDAIGIKYFKQVKECLDAISRMKKELFNQDSNLLRKHLLGNYSIFNEVMQAILDNAYQSSFKGAKVVIVDNHNFFYRNFHGMPDMRDDKGRPTSVIKALTTLIKDIVGRKADYVIFANEGTRVKDVRKDILNTYKSGRSETPEDLSVQITECIKLLTKMGFSVVDEYGYEADDIIASYAKAYDKLGAEVVVISTDKDLYQIKNGTNIQIYNPIKSAYITEEDCISKFGVGFDKCLLVQALMGDATDSVPGIKGVGVKSAAALINEYGTLENLLESADKIKGKLGEKIVEGKDDALVSYNLVRLFDNLADESAMKTFLMPTNPFSRVIDELACFQIRV